MGDCWWCVLREASSSLPEHWAIVTFSTVQMVKMFHSHTLPAWLAEGALKVNSHSLSARNTFKASVSHCLISSLNSFFAPTKFVPWSQRSWQTASLRLIKHLKALMKSSVDMSSSISRWTAREDSHVKMSPYLLHSLQPCLVTNGPKQSIPQNMKGAETSQCSLGTSDICCSSTGHLSFRHFTHLCINLVTD